MSKFSFVWAESKRVKLGTPVRYRADAASNREKRQLVRKACEVAGLRFGTEVDLICDD